MIRKIKLIFLKTKKSINVLLLALAIVLLFVHHLYTDSSDRIAWYLREICGKLSYLIAVFVSYRTRQEMQHFLLEIMAKSFYFSIFAILIFAIIDSIISFLFKIHLHKEFLILQSISVLLILLLLERKRYKYGK